MKNNQGKVDILVILVIILANALLGFILYFFFIRDAESTSKDDFHPIQTGKMDNYAKDDYNDVKKNDRNNDRKSDYADDYDDIGAKDYIKDYNMWELGEIVVNPYGAENRFFVTSIFIEYRLSDKKLPDELKAKLPLFKGEVVHYFSNLTVEELRNIEKRNNYKRDVMRMINGRLIEGRITDLSFQQWVVQ
jgi:flagellar basal body-associated protein FliL